MTKAMKPTIRNTVIISLIAGTLALLYFGVMAWAEYTGGSGDGWSYGESVNVGLGGTVHATISSSYDQGFYVGMDPATAKTITITDTTGGAVTATGDLRIRIPTDFNMTWYYEADTSDDDFVIGNKSTVTFNSAAQSTAGNGKVAVSVEVADVDGNDTCRLKVEYSVDSTNGTDGTWLDPTIEAGTITADFGSPGLDNAAEYQLGTAAGWILTSSGSNTIGFNWLTGTDLSTTSDTSVWLRFTANDAYFTSTVVSSTAFTVDNVDPTELGSFVAPSCTSSSVTLTWSAASDANWTTPGFGHYELWYGLDQTKVQNRDSSAGNPATEWSDTSTPGDTDLAQIATYTTIINSGLSAGNTYYFKIWAIDDYGNEGTTTEVSKVTNNPPVGGYDATSGDNVIPTAQCVQATNGTGLITISFRIKDVDLNNCTLNTFKYSVNGGGVFSSPTNGDASGSLSTGWTNNSGLNYSSANGWTGTVHSFTFNTKHADVTGLNGVDQSDVQVQFIVNDGINNSTSPATSQSFRVDDTNATFTVAGTSVNAAGDTVALTFNEAMDTSTIANGCSTLVIRYADDGIGTNAVTLTTTNATVAWSGGNTVATITLNEATDSAYIPNGKFVSVTPNANSVKDPFGNSTANTAVYTSAGVTAETTAPTLSSVSATSVHAGGDTVALSFSEVMDTSTIANGCSTLVLKYANDGIGTGAVTLTTTNATVSWNSAKTIATITLNEATDSAYIPNGKFVSVTPNLNSVKDLVGNNAANTAVYTSAGVTAESTVPTLSTVAATSVNAGGDTIALTFSEVMDTSTIANGCSTLIIKYANDGIGTGAVTLTTTNATVSWNSAKTTATITLNEATDSAYIPNGKYVSITPNLNSVKDLVGNNAANTAVYTSAGVTAESTVPTLSTVAATSVNAGGDTIALTFSEVMDTSTIANGCSTLIIKYANDGIGTGAVTLTTTNATVSWNSAKTIATITLNEATDSAYIPNGKYVSITPNLNSVKDLVGNNAANTAVYTSAGVTAESTVPTLSTVAATSVNAGGDTIALTFSEVMDTSTIANGCSTLVIRYADNGSGLNAVTLTTTNATVSWNSAKTIATITLNEETDGAFIPNGKFVSVTPNLNSVKDLVGNSAGNTAVYTSAGVTRESTAPTLSSWTLNMHTHQMNLVFNEVVDASTLLVGSLTLQNTASSPTATYALTNSTYLDDDNTSIVITLSTTDFNAIVENTSLATSSTNSYLTMAVTAIDDLAGNDVSAVTTGMQVQTGGYIANTVPATNFKITTAAGSTMTAGTTKAITLKAYDASGFLTPTYAGDKTLTFSGAANSPDGYVPTAKDKNNSDVAFGNATLITFNSKGAGTSTLKLYCRADTGSPSAIKATDGTVVTAAADDLELTVSPETKVKVVFTQDPSTIGTINVALPLQPIVQIQDTFGNKTDDTDYIRLSDSSNGSDPYSDATGTLAATTNPLQATLGEAQFAGVTHNTTGTIYLYAEGGSWDGTTFTPGTLQPDFSTGITFSVAASSTVEAPGTQVSNFNLTPTNDTLDERFAVLRFKVKDAGNDQTATLIDRIQVAVSSTGSAVPSTDIAWAGLYTGGITGTLVDETTAGDITDTLITFGTAPDAGSNAGLYTVGDNSETEFTVGIYMKNSKLSAVEGNTFSFDIDETKIGVDTGTSSQMGDDSNKITAVTGTVAVTATHLEMLEATGKTTSVTVTAGATEELEIRATDANRNIDTAYTGLHTMVFSGLSTIGAYKPKIETVAFGYNISINFASGVCATNAVTLTAYAAETKNVSVQESGQSYSLHTLSVTVNPASAASIALVSGNNQSGATSTQLANAFIVIVKDSYGNPVSGESVTFAVSSEPGTGASLTTTTTTTSSVAETLGQASTKLTFSSTAGAYYVTATSGTLTGSPVTFSATALAPTALDKQAGSDNQSAAILSPLANALVVKLRDASNIAIPNERINFSIITDPSGGGAILSRASDTTDASGLADTTLTLGDTIGTYKVRASWNSDTLTADWTATATAGSPKKVDLTGPGNITAGQISTSAFTATLKDHYDNETKATVTTTFSLATTATTTGKFYSDSAGNNQITGTPPTVTISSDPAASSVNFWYKDTATGTPTITVSRTSGETLSEGTSDTVTPTIVPSGLSYFTVTATDMTTMTTGDSRSIKITAYDTEGNKKTNLTSMNVYFTGANSSPSPSSTAPKCSNSSGTDVAFGSVTLLSFSSGEATTTLKVYKAETIHIKAEDAATNPTVTTPTSLDIVVRHGAFDHLKFSGNIPVPGGGFKVGVAFPLGTLHAVDLYSNLCDGTNGATAYAGTGASAKTVNYSLSGTANSPDGTKTDSWTTSVDFTAGASTTTLTTILYRAQSTTITPVASDLTGTNVASNSITVVSDTIAKLSFYQQPSTTCLTNVALTPDPIIVAVADQYGNPVSSATDQVTLTASTTTGTYTAVTNGTLSATALQVIASQGQANYSNVRYSYPEAIYLRASVAAAVTDAYSYQITFSVASDDCSLSAGALSEPATLSSIVDTEIEKVQIFDFKATDAGQDGYDTNITKIIITRQTGTDTTGGWLSYIAGASISDGVISRIGTVAENALTFGAGTATIYTVPDAGNKTYTLSIYLKSSLPTGADGKVLGFDIDPNDDISRQTVGSGFAAQGSMTSSTTVNVIATKFILTGSATTVAAGDTSTLTIKATDVNGNIDAGYTDEKSLIFSGASVAGSGDAPECTNSAGTYVDFGSVTLVNFASGTNSSTITMKLYKAEGAKIKATDNNDSTITTSDANDWEIVVSGGTASTLSWYTQPHTTVVANAPWKPFAVGVTDAYENVSSSSVTITLAPTGGTASTGSTNSATAVSGIATFNNFRCYCSSYPRNVTLKATATGVTDSNASNAVTVVEKYDVTLRIQDSLTLNPLSAVTLDVLDSGGTSLPSVTGLASNPITGSSPFTFKLAYGTYQFNMKKDAYVETTVERVADTAADGRDNTYDNIITWTENLTSLAEASADYSVRSTFVYHQDTDSLSIRVWLERRGLLITNTAAHKLGDCTIYFYDKTNEPAIATITIAGPSASDTSTGVYYKKVTTVVASGGELDLTGGQTYFVKCTINYGGSLGTDRTYQAGTTFEVTISTIVSDVTAAIKSEVTGVTTAVTTQASATQAVVAAQALLTQAAVATQATATQAVVATQATATQAVVSTGVTTIGGQITTSQAAVTSKVSVEAGARILNTESHIRENDTLTIRYKTATGLKPTIDVYDDNNTLRLSAKTMTELVSGSGIYGYDVKFQWGRGEYTIVCSESKNGTIDGINLQVISTDLEQIGTSATTTMAQLAGIDTSSLEAASTTIASIRSVIINVSSSIEEVASLSEKVQELATTTTETIYQQLQLASEKLKEISQGQGLKIEEMYDMSSEQSTNVDYIRNKTAEIQAAVELQKAILEAESDAPVVQSWFETGEEEGVVTPEVVAPEVVAPEVVVAPVMEQEEVAPSEEEKLEEPVEEKAEEEEEEEAIEVKDWVMEE